MPRSEENSSARLSPGEGWHLLFLTRNERAKEGRGCLAYDLLSSRCTTQLTKGFKIEFHALLLGHGTQRVRLERVAVG